jgi:hypothetical protein
MAPWAGDIIANWRGPTRRDKIVSQNRFWSKCAGIDDMPPQNSDGKITARDKRTALLVTWLPWLSSLGVALPAPIIFLVLFVASSTTEAAAVYLFLTVLSAAIGAGAAIILLIALLLYRKRWLKKLRDRLALDGITASEVPWFAPELTSPERQTLRQMQARSPLLADAYCEILATRLMATRLLSRTKRDLLLVERRLNRLALIQGADTTVLREELHEDQLLLTNARREASARLAETQARMQMIEAAASRDLSHGDTYAMLQRLSTAQEHLPLTIEMAQLDRRALAEAEAETNQTS